MNARQGSNFGALLCRGSECCTENMKHFNIIATVFVNWVNHVRKMRNLIWTSFVKSDKTPFFHHRAPRIVMVCGKAVSGSEYHLAIELSSSFWQQVKCWTSVKQLAYVKTYQIFLINSFLNVVTMVMYQTLVVTDLSIWKLCLAVEEALRFCVTASRRMSFMTSSYRILF